MSIHDVKRARRDCPEAVGKYGPWEDWDPDGSECALEYFQELADGDNYAEKWESRLPDKFLPYMFEIRLHLRQAYAKAMALAETLYDTTDADVLTHERKVGDDESA